jgi:hypothetical protein
VALVPRQMEVQILWISNFVEVLEVISNESVDWGICTRLLRTGFLILLFNEWIAQERTENCM